MPHSHPSSIIYPCDQQVTNGSQVDTSPHDKAHLIIETPSATNGGASHPNPSQTMVLETLAPRLGETLVQQGLLAPNQLQQALQRQKQHRIQGQSVLLGQLLVEMGFVIQSELDGAVAQQIYQLKAQLERQNQQLEQQVKLRTAQLETALEGLARLDELKANFIATVSHELRTPLHVLLGNLELLGSGYPDPLTAMQAELLAEARGASAHLEALIKELLQFSEASSQVRPALKLTTIAPQRLVQAAVESVQNKAQARKIALTCSVQPDLPPVQADEERITWVLHQLLDNAIKFTRPGRQVVVYAILADASVEMAVKDRGIGIPSERVPEIFEPFHQLDGSLTRAYEGLGLGLALARRIVEAHGSQLQVHSEPGMGSTFAFTLQRVF